MFLVESLLLFISEVRMWLLVIIIWKINMLIECKQIIVFIERGTSDSSCQDIPLVIKEINIINNNTLMPVGSWN